MVVFCGYCDREFREHAHMIQHCEAKHYVYCDHCEEYFSSKEDLNVHENKKHYIYKCDSNDCNLLFLSAELMKEHWNEIHYFPCKHCEYYYPTQKELEAHDFNEHLTIKCQYCERWFREEKDLEQHSDAKHYFPCRYCDNYYTTQEQLDTHDYNVHLTFKCKHCNRWFRKQMDLNQHQEAKHYFPCKYCSESYVTDAGRSSHYGSYHRISK